MTAAPDFARDRDLPLLAALAQALDCSLDAAQSERLVRYVELVVTWNRKLDLTAARGAAAQLEVLLADSLMLARPEIIPLGSRCLDVGSGAGAPVLPLLLIRDDLSAELIEPLRKRVAFLRTVLGTLALVARVRVTEGKLDPDQPQPTAASFDVALSRATFAPEIWVPAATRIATRSLALLVDQPPPAAPAATRLLASHDYSLPFSKAPRRIAVYVSDSPIRA